MQCMNHRHNESAVLCSCLSSGDGVHDWDFNWTNACNHLLFTPSLSEHIDLSCNTTNVAINGHGNVSLSPHPSFVSKLDLMIRDATFTGMVNCSVIRNGTSENIGHFILSGTCMYTCVHD